MGFADGAVDVWASGELVRKGGLGTGQERELATRGRIPGGGVVEVPADLMALVGGAVGRDQGVGDG